MNSEIAQAIAVLRKAGYTVAKANAPSSPVEEAMQEYMVKGEQWENNPRQYVADIAASREIYEAAFRLLDYKVLMADWDDATLHDVRGYGSDLAFNKHQRQAMIRAAVEIHKERYPNAYRRRATNGMAE